MKIASYTDDKFFKRSKDPEAHDFSVLINPASYSHSFKISYNNRQAQGSSGTSPDFNRVSADSVKFELVFDGTGVVPNALPGNSSDGIKEQLEKFKKVVFDYEGDIHSPKYLILSWGTLCYQCRLSSLDFNYTLFKPDGTPLRARANVTFIAFSSEDELEKQSDKKSSDLSHLVTVKAGDTLPLLCFDIYGSSTHYLEVARANDLQEFRHLIPGTRLLFPPLQDAAT